MNLERFKRSLVGTALGRALLHANNWRGLVKAMRTNPEKLGLLSQEICGLVVLPQLCRLGTTFLDVGSHIGSIIAEVQKFSSQIRIIAIEAIPAKATALGKKFPEITVHSCAVGESTGEVSFFIDLKAGGFSSLSRSDRTDKEVREITVPMRKLDDLVKNTEVLDVMKIDIEGAELGALRGSEEFIMRCRPAIYFESGPREQMGYTHEDLFKWFTERNYQVFVPNRVAHNGPSLSYDSFLEAHIYPFRTLNYFALPAERRLEFRDRARLALKTV